MFGHREIPSSGEVLMCTMAVGASQAVVGSQVVGSQAVVVHCTSGPKGDPKRWWSVHCTSGPKGDPKLWWSAHCTSGPKGDPKWWWRVMCRIAVGASQAVVECSCV